jgi:hypothetical protein
MSFLWWQRVGDARIASDRLVLRAAEVPLLQHALALRDTLERRRDEQVQAITEAIAAGRAEGHAAGLAEGRADAALALADTVQRLAAEARAEQQRLRDDIAALALQVVRKLLGQFADDEVLLALAATAAADLLPGGAPVRCARGWKRSRRKAQSPSTCARTRRPRSRAAGWRRNMAASMYRSTRSFHALPRPGASVPAPAFPEPEEP